ncbi:MAG: AzlD domain-containing protein [Rhodocyclaceae bacterium]|nr:AzlD domain-containing protein [Rhodocyclaceae bacterium]
MKDAWQWLPLWLVCGLATFLARYSFIALEGRYKPPSWFVKALPFVPIVALSALTAPELLLVEGHLQIAGNAKLYAGAIAVALALIWRNALLTILGGFSVFWLLRLLG